MPLLVEQLERLTVTVVSPDGNLKATADSERLARFRLRDSIQLETYEAASLAHQVAAVLTALNDGRRRGIAQIRQEPESTPSRPHWDAQRRRFHAALDELTIQVRSAQGWVKLRARDRLASYEVKIHPQAPGQLDADGFLAELHSVYANLLTANRRERARLIREHRLG